jgi:hypothetical protein
LNKGTTREAAGPLGFAVTDRKVLKTSGVREAQNDTGLAARGTGSSQEFMGNRLDASARIVSLTNRHIEGAAGI